MKAYSYKDSGIEWLGEIPSHWDISKVKNEFSVKPSNVNKKSEEGEEEVKLCNYVDVYYNDFITNDINFMTATAKEHEINKFQLRIGDVIITKDSEDPFDIGVPACVKETQEKLLCGYHLSMMRTINNKIDGEFLFWSLSDSYIASQLFREATGVTRWAIASRHIKNASIAFPPFLEQKAIVDFLDRAIARIDRIISVKEEQLDGLNTLLIAKMQEATLKGLDKSTNFKKVDSEWIESIPDHWSAQKVKRICTVFRGKFTHRPRNDPRFYNGKYPFIQTGSITNTKKYIYEYTQTLNELGLSVSQMFPKGTLCMTIAGNIGDLAILNFDACFPDSIVGFNPSWNVDLDFLYYQFEAIKQDFLSTAIVTTQMNLNINRIGNVNCYLPPLEEQKQIVEYL